MVNYHQKKSPGKKKSSAHEKMFRMSVPVVVRGKNAEGEEFEEETRMKNISSETAIFSLENKVLVGSKLHLKLNIPQTLILKNHLNLQIAGEVERTFRDSENGGGQIIELELVSSFTIKES